MNFELNILNNEIDTLLDEFRRTLKSITTFESSDRNAKINECQHIVQQLRTAKEAYVLELRSLAVENRGNYEQQLRDRLAIFKGLASELEYKKTELDRSQITAEADEPEETDPNLMNAQQLMACGDQVQDQTQDSINRMKQMVGDAEQIGVETVQKMDQQIEQMGHVKEGLDDVEYNIERSKKTVHSIAKSASTDRCIQVLCCSIIVCIILIIILAVV
eukprot:GHVO01051038.1.p1 GENE.GHVO01051038.1~~GHVO01051038.1.p1  ORF type:complete len:218 (+),score=36.81 GHVO01051038.1:37-690(+)